MDETDMVNPLKEPSTPDVLAAGWGHTQSPLKPPMAYAFYAGLKPADLADIIAYLHTVPPLQ